MFWQWMPKKINRLAIVAGAGLALGSVMATGMVVPAKADKIRNPVAVFSGLDKITGRIISFEVNVDETVRFGALQITPRVCYTRPATESPNTTGFVEVDEVTLDNEIKPLFSGWMFASSPGLHGVEHPVFDAWLTECKGGTEVVPDAKQDDPSRPRNPPPARRRQPQ